MIRFHVSCWYWHDGWSIFETIQRSCFRNLYLFWHILIIICALQLKISHIIGLHLSEALFFSFPPQLGVILSSAILILSFCICIFRKIVLVQTLKMQFSSLLSHLFDLLLFLAQDASTSIMMVLMGCIYMVSWNLGILLV